MNTELQVCFNILVTACDAPDSIVFGSYLLEEYYLSETSVSYTCDSGYILNGDPERHCGNDGQWQWNATKPVCNLGKSNHRHPTYVKISHTRLYLKLISCRHISALDTGYPIRI